MIFEAPKRIAVDFDGTLCDQAFPQIGRIKPGAREALMLFHMMGYRIIIWSCRTCHWDYEIYGGDPSEPTLKRDRVQDMIAWLNTHGIYYDEIDDGSRGKPGADYYIDDKGVRFEDNWPEIAARVMRDASNKATSTNLPQTALGRLLEFPIGNRRTDEPEGDSVA